MDTTSFNFGCGLIATAPIFACHFMLIKQLRYILLSWFCSFVSTLGLILCSFSSLLVKNSWIILLYSVPIDTLGKLILRHFGLKQKFLNSPRSRSSIALSLGLGYALSHVFTLYIPIVFDQAYSIDFDTNHPQSFPNSLDLAIGHHAMSIFHIGQSMFLVRYPNLNFFLSWFLLFLSQFFFSLLSKISIISLKLFIMNILAYLLLIFGVLSFRTMEYQPISANNSEDSKPSNE